MEAEPITQKRQSRPSRRLLDPSNAAEQEVVAHRQTVISSTALESESVVEQHKTPAATSAKRDTATVFTVPEGHGTAVSSTGSSPTTHSKPKKVARTADTASQEAPDAAQAALGGQNTSSRSSRGGLAGPLTGVARPPQEDVRPATGGAARGSASVVFDPDNEVDGSGFLKDVEIINVDDPEASQREEKGGDMDNFFGPPYTGQDGKRWQNCHACTKKKVKNNYVAQISTLRRHMQATHQAAYYTWTKANHFESMLPKDTLARREKHKLQEQTRLNAHLVEKPPPECIIKYTDAIYREAAIEWLLATDQPLRALEHPAFKNMIDIAARATDGVKILNCKQTRREIIRLFKKNMTQLREKLNSDKVKGSVNLTCDAWQASNTDGYFAATGHWIEESAPGVWLSETALLGFVRLNNAHSGVRLGQALFKVVQRVGIEHKVGYITCDNAKNNGTMLAHFAQRMEEATGKPYDERERYVRCLAHIINLATQAVLDAYSKTPHYDPHAPDIELVNQHGARRDVIGLVRCISVKEHSSAKRKELFKQLQLRDDKKKAYQLLLDSPTRWSSTYVMLDRVEQLEDIHQFVYEIGSHERDRERRQKLLDLQLSEEEWDRVKTCLDLLGHADKAQQAFSAEEGPTLHHGLPALEALHKSWTARLDKPKYTEFRTAIRAGLDKVEEYNQKTADSDVYTFAMLLDPSQKARHLDKFWRKELRQEAVDRAETIYKKRYYELAAKVDGPTTEQRASATSAALRWEQQRARRRVLSDDEDSDADNDSHTSAATALGGRSQPDPWRQDFHGYLNSPDDLGGKTIVQWWGINASWYPIWASLARDFLSVMASSVSSERAFSSAGITISKRRNRLKGDIVEALQALKCLYRRDLLFRDEPEVSSEPPLDDEGDNGVGDGDPGAEQADEEVGWDDILLVDDDLDGDAGSDN
ncbi:hypothetical protein TRAPUB_5111 [Trametes pubescens]|uniref:HAT C-terminal dimerisation domain-containing protein n=1 Tax=Trametes pubescens TaxID=154538 RepID=A0A1M2V9K6_TRAPU|nr:hypothetical protein TRAPUB_5111 [Trametes pubescens]